MVIRDSPKPAHHPKEILQLHQNQIFDMTPKPEAKQEPRLSAKSTPTSKLQGHRMTVHRADTLLSPPLLLPLVSIPAAAALLRFNELDSNRGRWWWEWERGGGLSVMDVGCFRRTQPSRLL